MSHMPFDAKDDAAFALRISLSFDFKQCIKQALL
jgi:hypothetical protein